MNSNLNGRLAGLAALLTVSATVLAPKAAQACACGCGVFDIGTQNLFPNGAEDIGFVSVEHMDQSRNWSGSSRAPSADNADKDIRTTYVDLGVIHMFNRRWGVMVDAPFGFRSFRTADGAGVSTYRDTALGDLKLTAVWTGLEHDMSSGLTFGLKLPTGDWRAKGFDRDTQLGSGATDVTFGAYKLGYFGRRTPMGWFARINLDQPVAYSRGYRPGGEADLAVGVYHTGWSLGGPFRLKPMVQVIASVRGRDHGTDANPGGTGYERIVVEPGLELRGKAWRLNADVGLPLYQRTNGDQLVAPQLFKLVASRSF